MQLCSFCISAFTEQLVHFTDRIGEKVIPRGLPNRGCGCHSKEIVVDFAPILYNFSQLSLKGK